MNYSWWRLYCITEEAHKFIEQENAPTVCPTNPAHTINHDTIAATCCSDVIVECRLQARADTVLGDAGSDQHNRYGNETWFGGELNGRALSDSYPATRWRIGNASGKAEFESVKLTPIASSSADNISIFVDESDDKLKFKDKNGALHDLI